MLDFGATSTGIPSVGSNREGCLRRSTRGLVMSTCLYVDMCVCDTFSLVCLAVWACLLLVTYVALNLWPLRRRANTAKDGTLNPKSFNSKTLDRGLSVSYTKPIIRKHHQQNHPRRQNRCLTQCCLTPGLSS